MTWLASLRKYIKWSRIWHTKEFNHLSQNTGPTATRVRNILLWADPYIGLVQCFSDFGKLLAALGWGLLSQFSPFRYFPNFSEWWKQWLPEWYQVHIWQVSPQLSCGDTWQIWTWLKVSNLNFCKIKISRNGEINERSFSNPHPRASRCGTVANWFPGNLLALVSHSLTWVRAENSCDKS